MSKDTHPGLTIFLLTFLSIISSATQTLIVPILGQLSSLLNAPASDTAWCVTITPLVSAVTVTLAGRLGDIYGNKRILFIVVVPMAAGLLICGVANSLVPMLIGRGLQGIGVGILPLSISLMRDTLPPDRLEKGVAVVSGSMGIGNALGLPLAAAIAQVSSWHMMFIVFAILTTVGLAAFAIGVPSDTKAETASAPANSGRHAVDVVGALFLALSLVSLLLPVSKGTDWGWSSPAVITLFVAFIILVALWVRTELHQDQPLTNLRTLAQPTVFWTDIASALVTFALYVQYLVFPQVLELSTATGYGLGQSMLGMALWYAPAGFVSLIVAPLTPRLKRRIGAKRVLIVACMVIAAGYALSTILMKTTWGLLIVSIIIQAGVSLAFGVIPILLMSDTPPEQTGAVNGFNMLTRTVGTSCAGAVLGTILAHLMSDFNGTHVTSLMGFHVCLYIGCAVALMAGLAAIPTGKRRKDERAERNHTTSNSQREQER